MKEMILERCRWPSFAMRYPSPIYLKPFLRYYVRKCCKQDDLEILCTKVLQARRPWPSSVKKKVALDIRNSNRSTAFNSRLSDAALSKKSKKFYPRSIKKYFQLAGLLSYELQQISKFEYPHMTYISYKIPY
jgi:hypothetical protein